MNMTRRAFSPSRILLPFLLAAGAGLGSAAAQQPEAEVRRLYQVELLVFRNLGFVPQADGRDADTRSATPGPRVQFLLLNPLTGDDAPRIQPRDRLELASAWRRLERLSAYEPLLLTGWSQPVWSREAAPAHEIGGGIDPQISGDVTFYRQRYLHLQLDLLLTAYQVSPDSPLDGAQPVRIRGDRRIRIGETHFFDHPQYGVLARLIRLPEPESDES